MQSYPKSSSTASDNSPPCYTPFLKKVPSSLPGERCRPDGRTEPAQTERIAPDESQALAADGAFLGKQHEITQPPPDEQVFRRLERYELQTVARCILESFKVEGRTGKVQPPRVCKCLRVPRSAEIEIWKSFQHSKFFYGGLVICGSVWDCPICATKISERRRLEIEQAIATWKEMGGSVFMLTLTFPHYEHQAVSPLLQKFSQARRLLKNRKTWKTFQRLIQYSGNICRLEVTFGENGAHAHTHELFFSKLPSLHIDSDFVYPMWADACTTAGLDLPSAEHGVKISTPSEMAEYVSKIGKESSKWTVGHEMTKGHIKTGKKEGMTPWDLLRGFRDTGDCELSDKFVEYHNAFKGKRQLVWSDGLRDLLQLEQEKTDIEVAEQKEDDAFLWSLLDRDTWSLIRQKELRGHLLEVCQQGHEAVYDFLRKIKGVMKHV